MTRHLVLALYLFLLLVHPGLSPAADAPVPGARLFEGMGKHKRAVSTKSPEAQRWFDQGLTWAYAFNHDEAIRSFQAAAALDPDCAMAYWGIALCSGPHINNPATDNKRAWESIQAALQRKEQARPVDQALIVALTKRYAAEAPADRRPLDEAYAQAMGAVWKAHPDDVDVGTLYAEALMDLQPWDLWSKEGQPKGKTPEIVAVLETVLKKNPDHPGANHFYIHAVEASPTPEKGIPAADRLRTLVPAAGHLVHMPSHIDVRTGQWAKAAEANIRAMEADRRYRPLAARQGFYTVYMAHNAHFLAYASMMEGRKEAALKAARDMIAGVPVEYVRDNGPMVDPYTGIVLEVMMRFGQWDDILREPAPPETLPITTALWHFTRGVAHGAKGQVEDAAREREAFEKAVGRVPQDAIMAINPAHKVLSIARHVLDGEIAFRRKEMDKAVAELRKAITIEDDLQYMEPPDWVQPVRHTLGAFLVEGGRMAEAEQVYREDLKRWPGNGWSLYGLSQVLRAQGKSDEAAQVHKQFEMAWARADTALKSTCLCVR